MASDMVLQESVGMTNQKLQTSTSWSKNCFYFRLSWIFFNFSSAILTKICNFFTIYFRNGLIFTNIFRLKKIFYMCRIIHFYFHKIKFLLSIEFTALFEIACLQRYVASGVCPGATMLET